MKEEGFEVIKVTTKSGKVYKKKKYKIKPGCFDIDKESKKFYPQLPIITTPIDVPIVSLPKNTKK